MEGTWASARLWVQSLWRVHPVTAMAGDACGCEREIDVQMEGKRARRLSRSATRDPPFPSPPRAADPCSVPVRASVGFGSLFRPPSAALRSPSPFPRPCEARVSLARFPFLPSSSLHPRAMADLTPEMLTLASIVSVKIQTCVTRYEDEEKKKKK